MPDPAAPQEAGAQWFVLACRTCDEIAVTTDDPVFLPFESPEERGRWASKHTAGTGHDSWIVMEVDRD